jgi:hypothetical protein
MRRIACLFQSQRNRAANQTHAEYNDFFQKKMLKILETEL